MTAITVPGEKAIYKDNDNKIQPGRQYQTTTGIDVRKMSAGGCFLWNLCGIIDSFGACLAPAATILVADLE